MLMGAVITRLSLSSFGVEMRIDSFITSSDDIGNPEASVVVIWKLQWNELTGLGF